MACEDCLEVCFLEQVVGRICVWCLVIVAKRCGGCLKVINWGWQCKSQKRASFHWEGRFLLYNTAVLGNFIASLTGYFKRFYWSFHYITVVSRVRG